MRARPGRLLTSTRAFLRRRARGPFTTRGLPLRGTQSSAASTAAHCGTNFLGSLAANDLVEVTLLSASRVFLVEERQVELVELVEPLLPADLLQRALTVEAGKIEADNLRVFVLFRANDRRRYRVARFRPAADLVVIGGDLGSGAGCHLRSVFVEPEFPF